MAQELLNSSRTMKAAATVNAVTIANSITALRKQPDSLKLPTELRIETPLRISGLHGHNPKQNHLLADLPDDDFARLLPHLEFVSMPFQMTICETGAHLRHVYFPTSSIVSLLYETKEGGSTETAVIGNEGLMGVTLFMGGGGSLHRAQIKSAGYGFRLSASILNEEFHKGGALQHALLRYTQALLAQMSQTAVCNRHHSVGQQLCRWLLLSLDRLPSNEMSVSQGLIATMLGVRRESVTEAAGKLQEDGLIHYKRGHISVLDRKGLEGRACECYANVKREYDRLLKPTQQ